MSLQPFTVVFSRRAGGVLPSLGKAAWGQGAQPVWLRLLASRLYLKAGSLAYQGVTEAAPIGDRLVLAEDRTGSPLVVLHWNHQVPEGWKLQQWGQPPAASPQVWQWTTAEDPKPLFARFTAMELEQILSLVAGVDQSTGVLDHSNLEVAA